MTHEQIIETLTDDDRTFRDIGQVRYANNQLGHHFFDRDTLRFFSSRVHDDLYGGRYFVTSERDESYGSFGAAWDGERRYTIRKANPDGSIETVGQFGQYGSRSGAHAAAARLAGEVN
jgi:hypothetical protein